MPKSGDTRGIYLDHHATTPVDPRVAEEVIRHMVEDFGNANSVDHVYGEQASEAVEASKDSIGQLLSVDPGEIVYTSGSTQAIELALSHFIGSAGDRTATIGLSRVEHPSVIDLATRAERRGLAKIHWLEVETDASLDMGRIERCLPELDLLCLMAANNEVGTIYPVGQLFGMAEAAGVAMLVDATQAVGRVELNLSETPFDYLVLSGHKIYAPKGTGALVSPVYRAEDNHGLAGSHSPTPNVSGIAGLGVACRLMSEQGMADEARLRGLSELLLAELRAAVPDLVVNGSAERLAGNLHVSALGAPNDLVVSLLRGKVAISTGAACMSGAQGPSHVLQAMGLARDAQESALRIGLGRHTTRQDVLDAARDIASAVASARTTTEHA